MADTADTLGGLDILVNNAARVGFAGGPDTLTQLNEEMLRDDFDVKIMGYLRCAQQAAPYMERAGWGRIVNMDGMAARNAAGISGGLRNAAVMNFTKVMSEELGPKGITVNAVHPALSRTEALVERLQGTAEREGITLAEAEQRIARNNAIRRLVTVEEIASIVVFLCSEQAGCITGEAVAPAGGNSRAVFYSRSRHATHERQRQQPVRRLHRLLTRRACGELRLRLRHRRDRSRRLCGGRQ